LEDGEAASRSDPVDSTEALPGIDSHETTLEARVETALRSVIDPCSAANGSNLDVVEMGLVDDIRVLEGHVKVDLLLTTPACDMIPYFHESVEEQVGVLDGVDTVDVQTDHGFEWTEEMMTEAAKRRRAAVRKEYVERHQ
jgi:metal-sulfur cluster biosynthetic enzyme